MDTEVNVICRKIHHSSYDAYEQDGCAECFIKIKSEKKLKKTRKQSKKKKKKVDKIPLFEKKKMLKDSGIFKDTSNIPDDLVDVVFKSVV
ncbi:hypothetical protein JO84_gp178 [Aureococcus anophagefferens virus]|uniref:Uncharacterized protein n=1 Tax=Aureococcus anophagefferens virus TaxID=1474867 RepID=A0A076FHW2_9VIRU|nr:hypothetical protein JO84_gp178 [Aureococcus anophagefferens virus]AII17026.1 hypothetical protein AaV_297 [Aureococcus anophagefferens virus]UOG94211.1 hypothetical protein MKD35_170 [Aureococcus anophagefferens virus]